LRDDGIETPQDFGGGGDADVVLGEVDAGFEEGDEFEELRLDGGDETRDGALSLLCGDAGLVEGCRFDEIAYGLGAGQVDATVQVSAQGELTGFGEACTGFHGAVEAMAKDYGGTVAGDFDYVFGCVRFGRGEEGDDGLVDELRVVVIGQFGAGGRPGFEIAVEAKYRRCDLRGLRAGDADYAEASTSWRRGDRYDGVVQVQLATRTASSGAASATVATTAATITVAIAGGWFGGASKTRRAGRRRRRFGQGFHAGRVNNDSAIRACAGAFAAQFRFIPQGDVDDAALAAVHRIKAEGLTRRFHFIGRDLRGHAELFDAQRAIVVGIEGDARMIVGVHAQGFLRDVFESEEKLGAIAENQVDVVAVELDDEVGSFEVGVGLVARFQFESEVESRVGNDLPEELFDPRTGFMNRIFWFQFFFLLSLIIAFPGTVAPPGTSGAVRLKNHCCATPTKLLVR
jgi:hypothetical protein